ncbi:MAG: hypothetical protein WDW38_010602 [Sanguina aurantia]
MQVGTVLEARVRGTEAPSVPRQLATCLAHVGSFVSGAAPALQHVTHLELHVRRTNTDAIPTSPSRHAPSPDRAPSAPGGHPHLYTASRRALTLLAVAVPSLQHLQLRARYGEVDLSAFGTHCPALTHLDMDTQGDAMALQGVDVGLPQLTDLTLVRREPGHLRTPDAPVGAYYNTACMMLRGCTNLASLTFHSAGTATRGGRADCPPEMWDQLPASVVEWCCSTHFTHMLKAAAFMRRVRVLVLAQLPCKRLPQLLSAAPKLESLTIHRPMAQTKQLELMWAPDTPPDELARIRAHLLGGFKLVGGVSVRLRGSSEVVADMLAWLAPLADTRRVLLDFSGVVQVQDCLGALVRVVPNLEYLELSGCCGQGAPWLNESFLAPLVGAPGVWRMDVHQHVAFTHSGMVALCVDLPRLEVLYCWPCEGVSCEGVMAELAAKGRGVAVEFIVPGEFLPEAYED